FGRPWARYMLATARNAAPPFAGERLTQLSLAFGVFIVGQQAAVRVAGGDESAGGHAALLMQAAQGGTGLADSQYEGRQRPHPVLGLAIGRQQGSRNQGSRHGRTQRRTAEKPTQAACAGSRPDTVPA